MSKRLGILVWPGAVAVALGASDCLFDYAGAERCADGTGGDCPQSTSTSMTPSCHDGKQDEHETDKDCGGDSGCPRCTPGKKCKADTDCEAASCFGGFCTPSNLTPVWSRLAPSPDEPSGRFGAALASRGDGSMVLHGGKNRTTVFSDTYIFDDTWTKTDTGWPTSRFGAAMAFDAAGGVAGLTRLVGGRNGSSIFSGVYHLNATTWGQDTNKPLPVPLTGAPMVYDPSRAKIVLFGGLTTGDVAVDEVWERHEEGWSQYEPTGSWPSKRFYHAMAFDVSRGKAVMYGGGSGGADSYGDTWEYKPTSTDGVAGEWSQGPPAEPPDAGAMTTPAERQGHVMAYDSTRRTVVLFGGASQYQEGGYDDTWEYDGAKWKRVDAILHPGFVPRFRAVMGYDPVKQRMILFGGSAPMKTQVGNAVEGTWELFYVGAPCGEGRPPCNGRCVDGVCCDLGPTDPDCTCDSVTKPGVCNAQ